MVSDWFDSIISLGMMYGVDPVVFAILYVAGIPLFFAVAAWMAHRYWQAKPIVLQVCLLGYLLVQPYLYVVLFGSMVPLWVYGVIVLLLAVGFWGLYQRVTALGS